MTRSRPVFFVSLFAVLVLLGGCRTYGDSGYGSEAEIRQQMQQTVRQFADELERARADLKLLEEAADTQQALEPLVDRYREVVDSHEQTLASHRSMSEEMQGSGNYRDLHKNYGAMITDQRLISHQYDRTVKRVRATLRGEDVERGAASRKSDYFVEPTEYKREQNAGRLTMEEALQAGQ